MTLTSLRLLRFATAAWAIAVWPAYGQLDPIAAQSLLYLPYLADGGPSSDQWQTQFYLSNPHPSSPASVVISLNADDGQPLAIDIGSGPSSRFSTTIPPMGVRAFTTRGISPSRVTGWAFITASLPVQVTAFLNRSSGGSVRAELASTATLPSPLFRCLGDRNTSVSIANPFTGGTISVAVTAFDSSGTTVGRKATVSIRAMSRSTQKLGDLIPNLPDRFVGTIQIEGEGFIATAFDNDGNGAALAALPDGRVGWPISHWDRIWNVFLKLRDAAPAVSKAMGITVDFNAPLLSLNISADPVINAFATRDGNSIQINLALSELISDSPSELAFVIGHELGHIVLTRSGNPQSELVADQLGMIYSLAAGFDPYAGAGALAKLAMASGSAGLLQAFFDDLTDPHASFNTRLALMHDVLKLVCNDPATNGYCTQYKSLIHPHFPDSAPLGTAKERNGRRPPSVIPKSAGNVEPF